MARAWYRELRHLWGLCQIFGKDMRAFRESDRGAFCESEFACVASRGEKAPKTDHVLVWGSVHVSPRILLGGPVGICLVAAATKVCGGREGVAKTESARACGLGCATPLIVQDDSGLLYGGAVGGGMGGISKLRSCLIILTFTGIPSREDRCGIGCV